MGASGKKDEKENEERVVEPREVVSAFTAAEAIHPSVFAGDSWPKFFFHLACFDRISYADAEDFR